MYDSYNSTTGTQLYNADGDHTGVAITSTTGSITVFIDGDGSWNCQDGNGGPYTPLQFAVTCSAPQESNSFNGWKCYSLDSIRYRN